MKEVSVIIPIKNEPYISSLVSHIHRTLVSVDHEIIVVDESIGPVQLKSAFVVRQKSHGLGNAFKEGLYKAKGKYIIIMDGDGSHRPQDIPMLLSALSSSDFTLGSRFVKGGKSYYPKNRQYLSIFMGKFASLVLGLKIKDSMSGFAAMKRSAVSRIKLNPLGFKIVLEVAYKLKQKGFILSEVPISFLKRQKGESKVGYNFNGIKEMFRVFRLILELKLGLR